MHKTAALSARLAQLAVALLLMLNVGLLSSCTPDTVYSLDISQQSGLAGNMTPDDAVAIVRRKGRASGSDADSGSFALDAKGFRFSKTEKVTREMKVNGQPTVVEYDETRTQQVAWQAVRSIEPFLRSTIIGDLYGVELYFLESQYLSSTSLRDDVNLEIYCSSYEDLTQLVAALRVLTGT